MIPKYTIKVRELYIARELNPNQHYVKFFINKPNKTSKSIYSFAFAGEEIHKVLIDLQRVASGKEGESLALLYINHEHAGIRHIARTIIGC